MSGGGRTLRDGDLAKVEILGPEGVEVDPLEGWAPIVRRVPPVIYYDDDGNEYTPEEAGRQGHSTWGIYWSMGDD